MKTVWHWVNIGKAAEMVTAAGIALSIVVEAIGLTELGAVLFGAGAGAVVLGCIAKLELWHFEDT